jgi:hypothetical protein
MAFVAAKEEGAVVAFETVVMLFGATVFGPIAEGAKA